MRSLLLLATLALAGCASSGSAVPASTTPSRPMRVDTDAGVMEFALNNGARAAEQPVAIAVQPAWTALQGLYSELGIPITVLDPEAHAIGSQNAAVRRRLISTPLSVFLDCGRTAARTPIADSYAVNLTLVSQLQPESENGAVLRTLLQGRAKNPVNNDPAVQCSSTGRLEALIADRLRERAPS